MKETRLIYGRAIDLHDSFDLEFTLPEETIVYYSNRKNASGLIMMIVLLGLGLGVCLFSDQQIYAVPLTLLSIYFGSCYYRQIRNKKPLIILNHKGIQTTNSPFIAWHKIKNAAVVRVDTEEHTSHRLQYDYPKGTVHLIIDDFDIDPLELCKLLVLYRSKNFN